MSENKFLSAAQVESFNKDGYLIVDFKFEKDTLDTLIRSLIPYYNPEHLRAPMFGARIQDAWKFIEESHSLATNTNVLNTLEQLFGRKAKPFQTLNFPVGTQQKTHSDTIHFNSLPTGWMAGVWVALEDIDENNGPLQYYPESHLLPEITMQDANLEPVYHNYERYLQYVTDYVEKLELKPSYGYMPKGHALIWHGNLLHGGSTQTDTTRSRHSQVTHYFFEGCQYYTPMFSAPGDLEFRDPEWIEPGRWQMLPPVTLTSAVERKRFEDKVFRLKCKIKGWLQ